MRISVDWELRETLEGNLEAFSRLERLSHAELQASARKHNKLTLTTKAVVQVLSSLRSKQVSPDQVQRWASFVRRGYIGGNQSQSPIKPIDVEYALDREDEIVEIISRLDEIGDTVDGEVDTDELQKMIQVLSSKEKS